MIQLSIIIPMYNVEKYIHKCIHSVVQNNLKRDDFEIIIEEVPEDDDILVRNWRIQLDVKTTRKKLKEVQRIIEEQVRPIL